MWRGHTTSAEQVVLKLPQIEVQTAQGTSLALACTDEATEVPRSVDYVVVRGHDENAV